MNKDLKNLNEKEIEKVAGGNLTDEQVKKYFPDASEENFTYFKEHHNVGTCCVCGKEYVYNKSATDPIDDIYVTQYCSMCTPSFIEKVNKKLNKKTK